MIKTKIKSLLNDRGMTQIDLAAKLGVQPETLSRTISGNPTLKSLTDIANALEVEIIRLFSSNMPTGYVEYNKEVFKINSVDDIKTLLVKIENASNH